MTLNDVSGSSHKHFLMTSYSIRSPQGGTPPPLHFDVGRIGVGAPSDGCSRTVEGRLQMKVDRPPFSGTCCRHWFSACSWQVWGECSAPLRWKKQGGRQPQCSRSRVRRATLGDPKSPKSDQHWSPKRTKTRQNRTQWKIAVMSALRTTFGGSRPRF